jgi:trehalose-6-phosphate hydrolase
MGEHPAAALDVLRDPADWKRNTVVYQIYPRSFLSTDGGPTGDLAGVIAKLPYIAQLGCDAIWLTPVYASPQRDNGYDIADYHAIDPSFGTMEDMQRLLDEAHALGLKVIMDMVVNHTSTDHAWFRASRESRDNPYRDFYVWRDPQADGSAPTNWESKFGGPAWSLDQATGQYYLHLFDVTQADLNWEHEPVREAIYAMMNWWFDRGVDGFRLDVINLISKDQAFPQAPPGTDGRQFYTDGPRIHEFLNEMHEAVFAAGDRLTVGEMSSTDVEHCVRYTHPDSRELDMTFSFHHLKVDYPGGEKWTAAPFDLLALKDVMSHWQTGMQAGGGWNALFWCNHDQPRAVSRFGDDGVHRVRSAKMLATALHGMAGTPYIYQGEELGMTNAGFTGIEDYRDVESLNMYRILLARGVPEPEVLEILRARSRDNARTPMQWTSGRHAGFTSGTPWIDACGNEAEINAEAAVADPDSVYWYYNRLIRLRRETPVITTGVYELIDREHPDVFAYLRRGEGETLVVACNFRGHPTSLAWPSELGDEGTAELLIGNLDPAAKPEGGALQLAPYEAVVLRVPV